MQTKADMMSICHIYLNTKHSSTKEEEADDDDK
jgi:hypothetical protein